MKNAIYVIDPGMMEAGGHHAALVETLIESELKDVSVSLVVHKNFDGQLAKKAETVGIVINRHFECNFYQHYGDGLKLKLACIQGYVRRLAVEYTQILNSIIENVKYEKVVCFYPCLNWEHALALNLALSNIGEDGAVLTHKVCCMFKPPVNSSSNDVHYRLGFQRLSKLGTVELYASDWETREYYLRLEINIIDIHPCYLMPWMSIEKARNTSDEQPHILLYMGDAKVNKGFKQLPSLVRNYLKEFHGDVRLTIQYTLAWDYPELVETIKELDKLSEKYEQLTVDKSFWPIKKVVNTFNSIDAAVCSYDEDTYKNKSSGIAWLATFFEVPIIFHRKEKFWMTRELDRLGHRYGNCLMKSVAVSTRRRPSEYNYYYKSLFVDLIQWLEK